MVLYNGGHLLDPTFYYWLTMTAARMIVASTYYCVLSIFLFVQILTRNLSVGYCCANNLNIFILQTW